MLWYLQPTAGYKNWLSHCHLNVFLLILLGHQLMKAQKSLGLFRYIWLEKTEKFRLLMDKICYLPTWLLKLLPLLWMCFSSICYLCITVFLVNMSPRSLFLNGLFCWPSLTLQIPSSWKSVLEESSTLQIYFDYYALTKPPISKEVSSSIFSFVFYTIW